MVTVQELTRRAITEVLRRITPELKINFKEFEIEDHTSGKYRSGTWTYKITGQRVALEYWFSAFSSRKEEILTTFQADGNFAKLESDLRNCLDKVRDAVKRKKGMF
jgi:hypothetical protein